MKPVNNGLTPYEDLSFDQRARADELRQPWDDDFELFARERLHILDRDHPLGSRFIPFVFNPLQRGLHDTIEKIREFNRLRTELARATDGTTEITDLPIHLVILKARKGGCSTYLTARAYWRGETTIGMRGLVMAHEKAASQNIASMMSPFHYQWTDDDVSTKRRMTRFSGDHIAWDPRYQSEIVVKTAGARVGSSRSYTYTFVHLSEAAHFPSNDEVSSALNAAVPYSERYEESTANGEGNMFYDSWRRAMVVDDAIERLRTGRAFPSNWNKKFRFFWAWHQDPGYRRALLPVERERIERSLSEREKELIELFHLSYEQLAWRRDKIAGDCSDQAEMDPEDYFCQEYPSTPEEAFVSRGKTVFHQKKLQVQREAAEQNHEAGNLDFLRLRRLDEGAEFQPLILKNPKSATLFRYGMAAPGRQYIIGADAAEGLEHGDWSTCSVWDRMDGTHMEEIARFIAKVGAEELGEVCVWLALQYNNAFIIPEGRFPGNATCARIINLGYYNIYQRKNPDKVGDQESPDAWIPGYATAAGRKGNSKALIVELAVRQLRDNKILLRTPEAIRQWKIFQQLDGGYSAPDGDNDDCVMADLFAIFAQFTPGVAPFYNVLDVAPDAGPVDESPITQRELDDDFHEKAKQSRQRYAERAALEEMRRAEIQSRLMNRGMGKRRVRRTYD